MKRLPASELDDSSYVPRKRKKIVQKCKICVQPEKHLHQVTPSEATILSASYDLKILAGDRLCCRHWEYHTKENFSKKQRPALRADSTAYHTAPPLRKPPPKRIQSPASKDPGRWACGVISSLYLFLSQFITLQVASFIPFESRTNCNAQSSECCFGEAIGGDYEATL